MSLVYLRAAAEFKTVTLLRHCSVWELAFPPTAASPATSPQRATPGIVLSSPCMVPEARARKSDPHSPGSKHSFPLKVGFSRSKTRKINWELTCESATLVRAHFSDSLLALEVPLLSVHTLLTPDS